MTPSLRRGSSAVLARADCRLRGEDREAGQGVQGARGVAAPDPGRTRRLFQ